MKATRMPGLTDDEAREQAPVDYGRGRVCLSEGCATRLSRYNPRPFCYLHEDEWYDEPCEYNERGERRCRECGKWRAPDSLYWIMDERMEDGLSAVCRYCRRHPERVKRRAERLAEDPEVKQQRIRANKRARDKRYRDKKRAGV